MPPVRTSLTNTSSRFSCCRNSDIAAWGQGRGQGAGRAGLGLRPAPRAELTLRGGRGLGDEALPPRAHLRSRDGHRVFGVVAGGHDARGAALLTLFPGQAWGQREPQRVVVGSPHPCPAPPGMEAGRRCQGGPKDGAVMTTAKQHLYEGLSPLPRLTSGRRAVTANRGWALVLAQHGHRRLPGPACALPRLPHVRAAPQERLPTGGSRAGSSQLYHKPGGFPCENHASLC